MRSGESSWDFWKDNKLLKGTIKVVRMWSHYDAVK